MRQSLVLRRCETVLGEIVRILRIRETDLELLLELFKLLPNRIHYGVLEDLEGCRTRYNSVLNFSIDCVLEHIGTEGGSLLKVLSGANGDIMTRAKEVHKSYTTAPGHTSKGTYTHI